MNCVQTSQVLTYTQNTPENKDELSMSNEVLDDGRVVVEGLAFDCIAAVGDYIIDHEKEGRLVMKQEIFEAMYTTF